MDQMKGRSLEYLKDLVNLALEDYNSFENLPNFGNFTITWYILSKTGFAENLSLSNRNIYPSIKSAMLYLSCKRVKF
jgi:hypothetical protein